MGCMDPQLNKERTFELLRKKGAVKAVLFFNGGHDEGWVESITLTRADETTEDLIVWYCGGYTLNPKYDRENPLSPMTWVPLNKAANEDEELSDLLQGPIDEEFGTWASVESTSGRLVWDVEDESAVMDFTQDEPTEHSKVW